MIALLAALLLAAPALAQTPRASSDSTRDGVRHSAQLAFDGLLSTSWAEGEPGHGEGSWIELALPRATEIHSVSIWPGKLDESARTIREFARPKKVRVILSGDGEEVVEEKHIPDLAEHGLQRVDVPIRGVARVVRIEVDEVFRGGLRDDLHIAEIALNFSGPADPGLERLQGWMASSAGQAAAERNREEVIALFDRVEQAEFGDREALAELMDRASDGPTYLRAQVASRVPAGFRIQALPADDVAIEALLKLKDSNAIPAVERAAARSGGELAARYQQYASVFRAHQGLLGGARLHVPPFGEPGWAEGAFQSHEEPLAVVLDHQRRLWVADAGNHRVQRLGPDGRFDRSWGAGEPGVTDAWIGGRRAHYPAGNQPAQAPEGFTAPLDVAYLSHRKTGDLVAVLDGARQVSLLRDDRVVRHWEVPAQEPLITGVGGQAHLAWVKRQLVVIWGSEAFVYDAEGNEISRFTLSDGAVSGAVAVGNKVGLLVGRQLVLYSLDGFRHGDVMQDALGSGFDTWAITQDERGKYWALTDDGQLAKFKRPGRVDFVVRVDTPLSSPRFAVVDGVAFITSGDRILRIDALELRARQP